MKFIGWLKELLAEDNGMASAMRFCFVLSVLVSLGVCIAVVIKSWDTTHDIPGNVKEFLVWLTTALGLGKVGQKLIENKEQPPGQP